MAQTWATHTRSQQVEISEITDHAKHVTRASTDHVSCPCFSSAKIYVTKWCTSSTSVALEPVLHHADNKTTSNIPSTGIHANDFMYKPRNVLFNKNDEHN